MRDAHGWTPQTWTDFENKVHDAACAFLARGLTKGASVAILAGNIPEWSIIDIAAIAAGGVGVGIYPTSSKEQCEFIIQHSDAEFVVVDTVTQLAKVSSAEFKNVKQVLCIEDGTFSEFLERRSVSSVKNTYCKSKRSVRMLIPEDIAIMVYTSGTTGEPKGAMLSHRYILNSVESLRQSVPIFDSDIAFSYLPGCHVAERISGIYNRLYNGSAAYFVDDLSRLYEYMLEVKPTVFASLPRFFEKIHASIVAKHGTENIDPQIVKDAFRRKHTIANIRRSSAAGRDRPILRRCRRADTSGVWTHGEHLRRIQSCG
jgi:long-chain acyl-CoA synthetase